MRDVRLAHSVKSFILFSQVLYDYLSPLIGNTGENLSMFLITHPTMNTCGTEGIEAYSLTPSVDDKFQLLSSCLSHCTIWKEPPAPVAEETDPRFSLKLHFCSTHSTHIDSCHLLSRIE
jgi:hypothetical protein